MNFVHIGAPTGVVQQLSRHGRDLAYELRGLTAAQRALLATGLGQCLTLDRLTDRQLAAVFKVSPAALRAARKLDGEERADVYAGRRRLTDFQRRLREIVHRAGPEAVWTELCRCL